MRRTRALLRFGQVWKARIQAPHQLDGTINSVVERFSGAGDARELAQPSTEPKTFRRRDR
jgi:hypothetical protein